MQPLDRWKDMFFFFSFFFFYRVSLTKPTRSNDVCYFHYARHSESYFYGFWFIRLLQECCSTLLGQLIYCIALPINCMQTATG